MDATYNELIDFIVAEGRRIAQRAGSIQDIGVKKQFLTEEDIVIERGMQQIIGRRHPRHGFFSEEENDTFPDKGDVWIADPISGTESFIHGFPHYGIALAYVKDCVVQFGVVYDPSADELFTACRGKGAFLNKIKIAISPSPAPRRFVFHLSSHCPDPQAAQAVRANLAGYELAGSVGSLAVTLCHVACGRYDGIISFSKDSFPMFAGSLMVQEAGGIFTNSRANQNIHHADRVFVGGNNQAHNLLLQILCT